MQVFQDITEFFSDNTHNLRTSKKTCKGNRTRNVEKERGRETMCVFFKVQNHLFYMWRKNQGHK